MVVRFTVYGKPEGKGRPRFARQGGYVRAYTPQATKYYEDEVRWAYKRAQTGCNDFDADAAFRVDLMIYHPIPSGTSKRKRAAMLDGRIRPMVKPDKDNVEKIVYDALNGIVWKDDKQIVEGHEWKFYSDNPRVEIEIQEIEK